MRRRIILSSVVGAAFVAPAPSFARAPALLHRPVQILLPFPSDVAYSMARLVADGISQAVGQPVIIETRSGATGRVAGEVLKNAAPDGTTIAFFPIVVPVLAPLVFRQLRFDPARDFLPVTELARFHYALAVAPDHPARSVPEFMAWSRQHPARASVGTSGAGTIPHFFTVMINRAADAELLHVPYRNVGAMATDLMGGQIAGGIDALATLIEFHRAGRLRIIATTHVARSSLLPDVPTFAEQGLPGVHGVGWIGAFVPARTPRPIIDALTRAMLQVLRTPQVREQFAALAVEVTGTSPDEFAAIIAADTARWAPIVRASGFSGD
jgi:tripartite-type tricarboxylate transporter receptor subunit TctC